MLYGTETYIFTIHKKYIHGYIRCFHLNFEYVARVIKCGKAAAHL